MDTKELKVEQRKLEEGIEKYLDFVITSFVANTEIGVRSVSVTLHEINTYGKLKPDFMLSKVKVTLDV